MAKFYFYYSAMNAGKTTTLLQSNYNYQERGMVTLLLKPLMDEREGTTIRSRIGLTASAERFSPQDDLLALVDRSLATSPLHCVLVDEAQFMTRQQVYQLTEVVDRRAIPVLAYGLRTDFRGELFEGSQYLLAWADELKEIKTVCHCGRKANHVLRVDAEGHAVQSGSQIQIGGNEQYVSVCRMHFKEGFSA